MAFDLVEIQYKFFINDELLKEGSCPTFFVNTLANLYLTFDNPSEDKRLEIIFGDKVFSITAPIFT